MQSSINAYSLPLFSNFSSHHLRRLQIHMQMIRFSIMYTNYINMSKFLRMLIRKD